MTVQLVHEHLYWGLKLYEWLTLAGVLAGPVIAVVVTLLVERRRRVTESQTNILRMLLNTRHLVADPQWSVAINLIPVEFSSSKRVMAAWEAYITQVRYQAPEGQEVVHEGMVRAAQTTLIFRVMQSLGYSLSETDIQTSAYASRGFVDRDARVQSALEALPKIAESSALSAIAADAMTRAVLGMQQAPPQGNVPRD